MPKSTKALSQLFDGVMRNDPVFNAKLEDLMNQDSLLADEFLSDHRYYEEQYSFVKETLEAHLAEALALPWQDDFDVWWNSPVIRVGRLCLRTWLIFGPTLCLTGPSHWKCIGHGLDVVAPVFVKWVCLLVEPIAHVGDAERYDPRTIETFIFVVETWGSKLEDSPLPLINRAFPRLARTIVSLAVAFSTITIESQVDDPDKYEASSFEIHRLLYICHDKYPLALSERPQCLADATVCTMNWIVGTFVGKHSQRIRPSFSWFARFLGRALECRDFYLSLIDRGIVTLLSRALRKLVRYEVGTHERLGSILKVVLFMLNQLTFVPALMREALKAHLALSTLRVTRLLKLMSEVPSPDCNGNCQHLNTACADLVTQLRLKIAAFAVFPSFKPSLKASVKLTDIALARGETIFPSESTLSRELDAILRDTEFSLRFDLEHQEALSACSNKGCSSTDIRGQCSSCNSTEYCSIACQREHWKSAHKESCTAHKAADGLIEFRPLCNRDSQALVESARILFSKSTPIQTAVEEALESVAEYTVDSRQSILVIDFCPALAIVDGADVSDSALRGMCAARLKVMEFCDWIIYLNNLRYNKSLRLKDVAEWANRQRAGSMLVAYMFGEWVYHMSGIDDVRGHNTNN